MGASKKPKNRLELRPAVNKQTGKKYHQPYNYLVEANSKQLSPARPSSPGNQPSSTKVMTLVPRGAPRLRERQDRKPKPLKTGNRGSPMREGAASTALVDAPLFSPDAAELEQLFVQSIDAILNNQAPPDNTLRLPAPTEIRPSLARHLPKQSQS